MVLPIWTESCNLSPAFKCLLGTLELRILIDNVHPAYVLFFARPIEMLDA